MMQVTNIHDRSRGQPEGSIFNSYYNRGVGEGANPSIFLVLGMMQPGIEPTSPGSLVNILSALPMSRCSWAV